MSASTRRDFLMAAGCAAIGAAARNAQATRLSFLPSLAAANSVAGYKALVCVYLNGGNDGNNTIVPLSSAGWNAYDAARPTGSGLQLSQSALQANAVTPPSIGQPFGLHPSLTRLRTLFMQNKAAVVCNVGTLVEPIYDRIAYRTAHRPYQLFSHSDQTNIWQNARADTRIQTGWGGRIADIEPIASYPVVTSIAGLSLFTLGATTHPLAVADSNTSLPNLLKLDGFTTVADQQRRLSMDYLRTLDASLPLVAGSSQTLDAALAVSAAFSADVTLTINPASPWSGTGGFPDTTLGRQLKQIAKLIKLNVTTPSLGLARQIFFASLGGFDTHQNQVTDQANNLTQVSDALFAFYDWSAFDPCNGGATVASGVTTFTVSDFGRTLAPSGASGSVGSDHGWGNHAFVVGGSVAGGNFYGFPGPSGGIFPDLSMGGSLDTDTRGRWIPTVSVDQYAATLAKWFGLNAGQLSSVFPLLGGFPTGLLSFV